MWSELRTDIAVKMSCDGELLLDTATSEKIWDCKLFSWQVSIARVLEICLDCFWRWRAVAGRGGPVEDGEKLRRGSQYRPERQGGHTIMPQVENYHQHLVLVLVLVRIRNLNLASPHSLLVNSSNPTHFIPYIFVLTVGGKNWNN